LTALAALPARVFTAVTHRDKPMIFTAVPHRTVCKYSPKVEV
jgi:hypothetical protein